MIRRATEEDIKELTEVEARCFPHQEAAGEESIASRIKWFASHFLVWEENGKIISFVNGMVTQQPHLQDEMYHNASLHDEGGMWQMIFGVDTLPEYQRQGYAEKVLNAFIEQAREENRKGLVLTCKDHMISYYKKFGFVEEGISDSHHGGCAWHEMRLTF